MIAWILGLLLTLSPDGDPDRYNSIAEDISAAVMSHDPVWEGPYGRELTASLLVSIAWYESGFRADVDDGTTRGDDGRSCTLWQLNRGRKACAPLLANRALAAGEAIEAVRLSFGACPKAGFWGRLRAYTSGDCQKGSRESRKYLAKGLSLFEENHP